MHNAISEEDIAVAHSIGISTITYQGRIVLASGNIWHKYLIRHPEGRQEVRSYPTKSQAQNVAEAMDWLFTN